MRYLGSLGNLTFWSCAQRERSRCVQRRIEGSIIEKDRCTRERGCNFGCAIEKTREFDGKRVQVKGSVEIMGEEGEGR
jgi:hypothetical protein